MFKDLLRFIGSIVKGIVTSRLFVLSFAIVLMFGGLVARLFQLQIVSGESYQNTYLQTTEVTIDLPATRGTIRDRNGYPLAYDKLTYAVTFTDTGAYSNGYKKNIPILELIRILNRHNETVAEEIPIGINENGEFEFTTTGENQRLRYLRDLFYDEAPTVEEIVKAGYDKLSAREIYEYLIDRYGIGFYDKKEEKSYPFTDKEGLQVINIRVLLAQNSYRKYLPVTVAKNVSMETVAEVMENAGMIKGADVSEESIRVYNDTAVFSPVIGYIGEISAEQLETFQKDYPDAGYTEGDIIGKVGIESTMENVLQGKKGSQTMYVDNQGKVLEVIDRVEPQSGGDTYLTLDRDYQAEGYRILEQNIAKILVSKIVNRDVTITLNTKFEDMLIPVKDVYFQLINNNVLKMAHFNAEDATPLEKSIYEHMVAKREATLQSIGDLMFAPDAGTLSSLSEEMQDYLNYIVTMLTDNEILLKDNIDTKDEVYKAWKSGTINFQSYLYHALTSHWIDTGLLHLESKYSSTEETFAALVDTIKENLLHDNKFTKMIYKSMIEEGSLKGKEVCLALFDQGVLEYDETAYTYLSNNGENAAYSFIMDKITNLEITPAQLALDPCSGSMVVTNVNTGEVIALVSYPSYDSNQVISNRNYYNQLLQDLSKPLYSRATQVRTAPGSIFKMITTVAGLTEGVLSPEETMQTSGIFEKIGLSLRCENYPATHGTIGIAEALVKSCNYFFCEVGLRLSTDAAGNYNDSQGLEIIRKYASMFGFDRKSGIELEETEPHLTEQGPVPSSIGQGSHSYTNTQLNRYLVALATRGNVYNLSILDKTTSASGELITDYTPEIISHVDLPGSTWDIVQGGMRQVIETGALRNLFSTAPVAVAGKTGTAEENKLRANHSNFIAYAPYENPEIAVSVNIPNGYAAGNAARAAKEFFDFYFGDRSPEGNTEQ